MYRSLFMIILSPMLEETSFGGSYH